MKNNKEYNLKKEAYQGNIKDLLKYILDDKKYGGNLIVNTLNCNIHSAETEIEINKAKWNNASKCCVYYLIQDFCSNQITTPQEANNIGIKMCSEQYPNFQCIVSTHIKNGRIHNHIVISSVSLDGKDFEYNRRLENGK